MRRVAAALLLAGLAALAILDGVRDDAVARSGASQRALERGDAPAARRLALAALRGAPMDAAALRVLALSSASLGDAATAQTALEHGSALGWRDTPTQVLLLADALTRKDLPMAAARADALARRERELPLAFAALRSIAGQRGGGDVVAERLALAPPYRDAFLADVGDLAPADFDTFASLLDRLADGARPTGPAAADPFVRHLLAAGEPQRARAVWLRYRRIPASAQRPVQDERLEAVAAPPNGFGWEATDLALAGLRRESDGELQRDVLALDLSGTAAGPLLSQRLVLSPGMHRLRIVTAGSTPLAEAALAPALLCGDYGADAPLERSPDARQGRWTTRTFTFAVPREASCAMQTLRIDAKGTDSPGQLTAWLAAVAID